MSRPSTPSPPIPPSPSTNSLISSKKTTKVYFNLTLEFLSVKRPLGKGTPASEIPVVQSSHVKVGAPPNWKSKASSIKNQGTCGSCWAFTSAGLYESFMMFRGKPEEDLSEQFILECTNVLNPTAYVSDCIGGYTDFALEVVKKYGMPKESQWPYTAGTYGTRAGTPSTAGICSTSQSLVFYNQSMGAK